MNVVEREDLIVHQIKLGSLKQYSYIIAVDKQAIVVDPLRDVQQYLAWIKENMPEGSRITHTILTEIHSDFISGHVDLMRLQGSPVILSQRAETDGKFSVELTHDGQSLPLGAAYHIKVIHTPGHTIGSSCYVIRTNEDEDVCVFTGDTLYNGDVGRPDLTQRGEVPLQEMGAMLFDSLRKLEQLGDGAVVLPVHSSGYSSQIKIGNENASTIGAEREGNEMFALQDKQEFIQRVSTGLELPSHYHAQVVKMNRTDEIPTVEELVQQSLNALTVEQFKEKLALPNTYVIDTRGAGFDEGHVPGSLFMPAKGKLEKWAGDLTQPTDRILLVTPEGAEADTITRLSRTGIQNVEGYLEGGFQAWLAAEGDNIGTINTVSFESVEEFTNQTEGFDFLDVRTLGEWSQLGVFNNANNRLLSIHLIRAYADSNPDFVQKLAPSNSLAVNCMGGTRSKVALSFLKKHGLGNGFNVAGGFRKMGQSGLGTTDLSSEKRMASGYE